METLTLESSEFSTKMQTYKDLSIMQKINFKAIYRSKWELYEYKWFLKGKLAVFTEYI